MKRLTLIRHAKSSWGDPGARDIDRKLNGRGKRDAPEMGRRLKARGFAPDGFVASPAMRAIKTAKIIAGEIGFPEDAIGTDERIYEAGVGDLLAVAGELNDAWGHAVMIGHNPGFTQFAVWLGDRGIDNVPTCGVVDLQCDVASWGGLAMDCATLLDCDFPKRMRDEFPARG